MRIALSIKPLNFNVDTLAQVISDVGRDWRLKWLAQQASNIELADWSCGMLQQHSTIGPGAELETPIRTAFFVGRTNFQGTTEMKEALDWLAKELVAALPDVTDVIYMSEVSNRVFLGSVPGAGW